MIKNGFTLVELLAVLVILALVIMISVPGVSIAKDYLNKKSLEIKIGLIESGATLWGQDNKSLLNTTTCEIENKEYQCYKVPISTLLSDNFIDSDSLEGDVRNPVNNYDFSKDNNCFGYVYKKNNRIDAYFGENSCKNGFK